MKKDNFLITAIFGFEFFTSKFYGLTNYHFNQRPAHDLKQCVKQLTF